METKLSVGDRVILLATTNDEHIGTVATVIQTNRMLSDGNFASYDIKVERSDGKSEIFRSEYVRLATPLGELL